MFRGALSPHRQPHLDDQQPPTPSKTSASLRNLNFGKDEQLRPHDVDDRAHVAIVNTPNQPALQDEVTPQKKNPRDTFQRASSHPIRLDASAALSASRSFDPSMTRAAALDSRSCQLPSQRPGDSRSSQNQVPPGPPSLRGTFGSGCLVVSTVISVLFQAISTHNQFIDSSVIHAMPASPPSDNSTLRRAKLLYISLLERAQKERGEWQGFSSTESKTHRENDSPEDGKEVRDDSINGFLQASFVDTTKEEMLTILSELLDLSFKNLRVALITPAVYSEHKQHLEKESLACPVSLDTLLRIRAFVAALSQDEKVCLLKLLSLWKTLCIVEPATYVLAKIAGEKHSLILSECSEMEFMQQAACKTARSDPIAINLLVVMAHYRDILFSDLEFFEIRREMDFSPRHAEPSAQQKRCSDRGIQVSLEEAPAPVGETKRFDFGPRTLVSSDCTVKERRKGLFSSEGEETGNKAAGSPADPSGEAADTEDQTSNVSDDTIPMAVPVILDDDAPMMGPSASLSPPPEILERGSVMAVPLPRVAQPPPARTKKRAMSRRACDSDKKQAIKVPRDKLAAARAAVSPRAKPLSRAGPPAADSTPHHDGAMGPQRGPALSTLVVVSVVAASLGVLSTAAFFAVRRRNQ